MDWDKIFRHAGIDGFCFLRGYSCYGFGFVRRFSLSLVCSCLWAEATRGRIMVYFWRLYVVG